MPISSWALASGPCSRCPPSATALCCLVLSSSSLRELPAGPNLSGMFCWLVYIMPVHLLPCAPLFPALLYQPGAGAPRTR